MSVCGYIFYIYFFPLVFPGQSLDLITWNLDIALHLGRFVTLDLWKIYVPPLLKESVYNIFIELV